MSSILPSSRLSEAETAQRMLAIAVARLEETGLSVGLEDVGMEAIIKAAGVSRATAYRRWPNRKAFVTEVLVQTVGRANLIAETGDDIRDLLMLLQRYRHELGSASARRDLVVQGLRLATDRDLRRLLASVQFRNYLSLSVTYHNLPDPQVRAAVGRALSEKGAAFRTRRAAIYAQLAELIGYRLSDPSGAGFAELSEAAGLTMTGMVTQALTDAAWLDERRSETLFGTSGPLDWSVPEKMLVGLLLDYMEPDEERDWSEAAITEMIKRFEREAIALAAQSAS